MQESVEIAGAQQHNGESLVLSTLCGSQDTSVTLFR